MLYRNMKIIGVYHIGCVNDRFGPIVVEQLTELQKHGLYDIMTKLVIFVSNYKNEHSGLESILKGFDPKNKFVVNYESRNLREKFAINGMKRFINDETYLFYFHTKGVTRVDEKFHQWRKILNLYTLKEWKLNIQYLKKYDAVGCFLSRYPALHFSGNFWWSRVSYIKKLPRCGDSYLAPEMWVGSRHEGHHFISLTNKHDNGLKNHLPPIKSDIRRDVTTDVINNEACKHFRY